MRAPLSWIRDFTPIDAPVVEIADALNQLGLEVDDIDEPGKEIQGVIAARILAVVPHPDADKIRLADIEFGAGRQLRVVCGAPNIESGMVVPFAQVGAVLPGDFKITSRLVSTPEEALAAFLGCDGPGWAWFAHTKATTEVASAIAGATMKVPASVLHH